MSIARLGAILRLDLAHNLRRPLFWILILLLGFLSHGLTGGHAQMSSGNTTVGGTRAWMTSEFSLTKIFSLTVITFYSFFIAIAAGMAIIRDDEAKVGDLLHATPLKPVEYVGAKFLGALLSFCGVLGAHIALLMFFNHVFPHADAAEIRGPFGLINYLRPALFFGLPAVIFVAGTSFAFGEFSRRPILVFVVPVSTLIVTDFFLWNWSPGWLDPRINRLLGIIDPSGLRWLNETWLKVDRGVDFYNTARVGLDAPFLLSRLGLVLIGVAAVALSCRHFGANLRGKLTARRKRELRGEEAAPAGAAIEAIPSCPRGGAATTLPQARMAVPGFPRAVLNITRVELAELGRQAGLYLFIPLILLQTFFTATFAVGVFGTPLLLTPGGTAARTMNTLTLLVCLLALFYMVESMLRERKTGLAPILHATPTGTTPVLCGKMAANCLVGVIVVLATLAGCAAAILVQGKVALDLRPFGLLWGALIIPTFLVWTAFVTAVQALVGNRYTTYGICLGALSLTGYLQAVGKMNWVGNWCLWDAVGWSDMGVFELDRSALLLNRIMVLGLAAFLIALAVRVHARRDRDAVRTVERRHAAAILRGAGGLLPFMVVPIAAGIILGVQVHRGFQGGAVKRAEKDYWKQNLATWRDAALPALRAVELDLELDPSRHWFRVEGRYDLVNEATESLAKIPLTGGVGWENIGWVMNGEEYEPEDRSRLFVFTPDRALGTGDSLEIGFAYEGVFPRGITKNGGGITEFILPSGVVLTSFQPSFLPVLGYDDEIGVEDDNRYEPRVYPEDFYQGLTEPARWARSRFTTHVRITGPPEYTFNSVGVLVSDEVVDGKRIMTWESDHPVRFFNVVAGKWDVRRGESTVIYHHPEHTYNIDEMLEALDGARHYYSRWFMPFPWTELRLSEFPDLAGYAQGFPTNITFSEGIGFLTKSEPRTNTAFAITAHEAAHQWWGNILVPGEGPGGEILSEGMAHFSTIMLLEEIKGLRARMEFCRRIEEHYGDARRADAERPMIWIDGSRPGDETVTYDKGGWVFWMLLQLMGREAGLAGLQEFMREYAAGPDYPVLQDLVATMRPFAPDAASYGEFVEQWFFQVVLPEYLLSDVRRVRLPPDEETEGGLWEVTALVTNVGTGCMPVEVAAVRGERFLDHDPAPGYRESRVTVILAAEEKKEVKVLCDFEPDRVVVDPEVLVLQLEREDALFRF